MKLRMLTLIAALVVLAGCRDRLQPDQLPTPASISGLETALPLTQNAPPPPFNGEVRAFDRIDNNLNELAGGRYVVELTFTGVYAGTDRTADATARAEVTFDQISSARRVLVQTTGALLNADTRESLVEGVRLGPDAFLVRDGVCLTGAGDDARLAASLSAGQLIGGAVVMRPAGGRATINGEDVYRFTFDEADWLFPAVQRGDTTQVAIESFEVWLSPAKEAVVRYHMNFAVQDAVIFGNPQAVTGRVLVRYDAYELDAPVNITVPFGC
jgi:hypothetical protein